MKIRFFTLVLAMSVFTLSSMGVTKRYVLHINKTDKTVEKYDTDDIESLESYPAPDDNRFEAVDLGLSVEWATANLDIHRSTKVAKGPEGQGGHYGWGDPTGNHSEQPDNSSWTPYEPDRAKCLSYYGGENPPKEAALTACSVTVSGHLKTSERLSPSYFPLSILVSPNFEYLSA